MCGVNFNPAAKSCQSCPTLCDPRDGSPPGYRPWDSPGKNTGAGCHFFLQCMKVKKWKWSRSVMSDSSLPHGLWPTRLLHPWDFPGKSTGVGCILAEFNWIDYCSKGFPGGASGKERVCQWGRQNRPGFNPWVGKIPPGGGHGNPLQYSCLENPGDRGAWRAAVHRVAKSLN